MPSERDVKDVAYWKKFVQFVAYGSKEKWVSVKC